MNPKPFSALNHFTVPVLMNVPSFLAPYEPDRCSGGDRSEDREGTARCGTRSRNALTPQGHPTGRSRGRPPGRALPAASIGEGVALPLGEALRPRDGTQT